MIDAEKLEHITCESIRKDPILRDRFEIYCSKSLAEENWSFYLEYHELIEASEAIQDQIQLSKAFKGVESLFFTYFHHDSQLEVNVSSTISDKIRADWKQIVDGKSAPIDKESVASRLKIFEPAEQQIEYLINSAILKPFILEVKGETREILRSIESGKKNVVIIGGGFLGSFCASSLQQNPYFQVILIDKKPSFEMTPFIIEAMVQPKLTQTVNLSFKDKVACRENCAFIQGSVESIIPRGDQQSVFVNGQRIPFNYLVLGMGSSYASGIKANFVSSAFRSKTISANFEKLQQAKSALIVGGGAVGIELAGTIKIFDPTKRVILIDPNDRLMKRLNVSPSFSAKVHKFLISKGVEVILGERYKCFDTAKNAYVTEAGTEFQVDLFYLAVGISPNSQVIRKTDPNLLNERGYVKTNLDLRVEGLDNVFCGGDLKSLKEAKVAQVARYDGRVIAQNIVNLEAGKALLERGKGSTFGLAANPFLILGFINTGFVYVPLPTSLSCCLGTSISMQLNLLSKFRMDYMNEMIDTLTLKRKKLKAADFCVDFRVLQKKKK